MTNDEAEAMLKQLSEHFHEPVMPVTRYCDALDTWANAVRAGGYGGNGGSLSDAISKVWLAIRKSNLLFRVLYLGQPLRTKKCPRHDGRWSGYGNGDPCPEGCSVGADITGWLP